MDSIAALQVGARKTSRRLAAIPKNVTIFGESAGSGYGGEPMMAIPSTKGLFERAIGESSAWSTSPGARNCRLWLKPKKAGTKAAERMGAKSLAELRAKPAADILRGGGRGASPIVDGFLIREDPGFKVFSEGKVQMPAVLVGSNRDESFWQCTRAAQRTSSRRRTRPGATWRTHS